MSVRAALTAVAALALPAVSASALGYDLTARTYPTCANNESSVANPAVCDGRSCSIEFSPQVAVVWQPVANAPVLKRLEYPGTDNDADCTPKTFCDTAAFTKYYSIPNNYLNDDCEIVYKATLSGGAKTAITQGGSSGAYVNVGTAATAYNVAGCSDGQSQCISATTASFATPIVYTGQLTSVVQGYARETQYVLPQIADYLPAGNPIAQCTNVDFIAPPAPTYGGYKRDDEDLWRRQVTTSDPNPTIPIPTIPGGGSAVCCSTVSFLDPVGEILCTISSVVVMAPPCPTSTTTPAPVEGPTSTTDVVPTTTPELSPTTTDVPPTTTTLVPPPATTTDVPPPATTTTQEAPPTTTSEVPPPATTSLVPPPATTSQAPPPATTSGAAPAPPGTTTAVPAPPGTTSANAPGTSSVAGAPPANPPAGSPSNGAPSSGSPSSASPSAGTPSGGAPSGGAPSSGSPSSGSPSSGSPSSGSPSSGSPSSGSPSSGSPSAGSPSGGSPSGGSASGGSPSAGSPSTGSPSSGAPSGSSGNTPSSGNSGSGASGTGQQTNAASPKQTGASMVLGLVILVALRLL